MWHRLRFFSLRTIPHGSPELFWTLLAERSWSDRLKKIAQSCARVSIAITGRSHTSSPHLQRMACSYQDHGSSFSRGSHFASAPTRYRSPGEGLCTTRITSSLKELSLGMRTVAQEDCLAHDRVRT